jgi:histidyl-tRNA synthetase
LTGFGLSPEAQGKVFDRILDGDVAVLTRLKEETPDLARLLTPLLDLKGETPGFLRNLKTMFSSSLPEFIPALDNFIGIVDLLTAMGFKYQIDIASGRGFEYYTGMIFQIYSGDAKLGGGGRYDALIPLMGGDRTPASGFALQMNTLMNEIELPQFSEKQANKILINMKNDKPNQVQSAYRIAENLRAAGFIASIQVDKEDRTEFRWMIDVDDKSAEFVIYDLSNKRKLTAGTVGEILKLLGGKGGS